MQNLHQTEYLAPVEFEAYVSISSEPPWSVPISIDSWCSRPAVLRETTRSCRECPLVSGTQRITIRPSTQNDDWMQWVGLNRMQLSGQVRKEINVPKRCPVNFKIVDSKELIPVCLFMPETNPVQALSLIPGFKDSVLYRMKGVKLHTSAGRLQTIIFPPINRVKPRFEDYSLPSSVAEELRERFPLESPVKRLIRIRLAELEKVTGIIDRPRAHLMALLTLHSRLDIQWRGKVLGRGTLDTIIIGEQGTGKSDMANALIDYFDLGKVISGEIASRAGLLAGSVKGPQGSYIPSPGRFVMEHQKAIILDEAHHFIESSDFELTSQWRSSGIINIDKAGANRSFPAQVRLLWIANPAAPLNGSSTMQSALCALVKKPEDRRRFDLALLMQKMPVNKERPFTTYKTHRDLDRQLLLHTWSQIEPLRIFERTVQRAIVRSAEQIRLTTSPLLPELTDPEAIEATIVRVAAAVAETIYRPIDTQCVRFAEDLIAEQLEIDK